MAENSVDASLDDVSVKVECVDEDYEYNSSFPTDTESFTAIKTDHSEPDESYGLSTKSQRPAQAEGTTQTPICMPLISSPPIINRAQLLNSGANITANTADVQPKKQIAALVKVAAPSSTCTTIKQDVDKACYKLSQEGEQSLFLSVNVEKKLCSYVGSDMGRQFLSKRPDIMEHFFQFCQDYLRNQNDGNSTIPEPPTSQYSWKRKQEENSELGEVRKKHKRNKKGTSEESDDISMETAPEQIRYAELIFTDGYDDSFENSSKMEEEKLEQYMEESYEISYNDTTNEGEIDSGEKSIENDGPDPLQDFVSNLVTMAPKANKKRGTYKVYSADLRAKIGKHAAENGVASACRLYGVKESTGRSLKKAYLRALEMEPSKCILQLPKRDKPIGGTENSATEKEIMEPEKADNESESMSQSELCGGDGLSDGLNDSLSETVQNAIKETVAQTFNESMADTQESAKENENQDILQDFVSNLITMAPKENKREKRGSYKVYSADLRAKIGKYAVDNGVACAARYFDVRESTVRSLKKAYLKALENDPSKNISELPKGDRGRPLVLGKYDEEVLRHVKKIEGDGGIVNSWIIMSISKAVLMHRQKSLLAEFGGPIDITKTLAKSILRRFGYSKSRTTKSFPKPLPSNFSDLKTFFMSNLTDYVKEYAIPNSLVIFVHETSVPMVPGGNWTLDKEGSRQLTIPGIEDKRQMTIGLACTADGHLMQPQVIYKGKTDACLPKYQFPDGWVVSQSTDLLANADTAKSFLNNSIIPYISTKIPEDKPEQRTLLIWDLSTHQKENEELRDLLNRNNIDVINVPPNCKEHLHPLEILVNQHYIVLLEKEFQSWYSDIVLERLRGGETDDNMATMVDLRLSLLKPVHASWLVKSHEAIVSCPEIIGQCIMLTGVSNTLSEAQQENE